MLALWASPSYSMLQKRWLDVSLGTCRASENSQHSVTASSMTRVSGAAGRTRRPHLPMRRQGMPDSLCPHRCPGRSDSTREDRECGCAAAGAACALGLQSTSYADKARYYAGHSNQLGRGVHLLGAAAAVCSVSLLAALAAVDFCLETFL